jgi:intraflagellar transport protein 52
MFHDHYIDKEENSKLQDVIFRWLTSDDITLNAIDAEDPEVHIQYTTPDVILRLLPSTLY